MTPVTDRYHDRWKWFLPASRSSLNPPGPQEKAKNLSFRTRNFIYILETIPVISLLLPLKGPIGGRIFFVHLPYSTYFTTSVVPSMGLLDGSAGPGLVKKTPYQGPLTVDGKYNSLLIGPFKGTNKENKGFVPICLYQFSGSKTKVFTLFSGVWRV